jgi:glycogen synthase
VGFSVGGIPDIVRPGLTGLLAMPGDAVDLRRAIVDLLKNAEGRKEMAIHCRKIATQEYALDIQVRHYLDLYREILGKPRDNGRQERSGAAAPRPETNLLCSPAGLLGHIEPVRRAN